MLKCPHCSQEFDARLFWVRHVKYCEYGPNPRRKHEQSARDESLDCYWCGKLCKDFKELAIHVQNHGVECFDEAISYYLKILKGENDMSLPAPEKNPNNVRKDFLTAKHFNGHGSGTVLMIGAREPSPGSNSYSDVFIDVRVNGKEYTWGLKASSRNYAYLFDKFGKDEKRWKGSVKVTIAKDKFINIVGA